MSKLLHCLSFAALVFLSGCASFFHNINPGNEILRIQEQANADQARQGRFPVTLNPRTWSFLDWYTRAGRGELKTIIERCWYWVPMMKMVFKDENLPEELIYLPVIESEFITSAVSSKRASGPWQFMSGTGHLYGLRSDWWFDERRDPEKSTRAAALHLKLLYSIFKDWQLALAAYNAGDGRISRAIRECKTRDFWLMCRKKKAIPKETQYYVPKFAAAATVIEHMKEFGLTNITTCDPLVYDSVRLPDSTDLRVVATCALTDEKVLHLLNPELKQWATPPVTNYVIKIPYGRGPLFESNFSRIPAEDRITYRRYRIQPGDSVSGIAHQYGVPQDIVVSFNRLTDPGAIVVDNFLIIPLRGVKTTNSRGGTNRIETTVMKKPVRYEIPPSFQTAEKKSTRKISTNIKGASVNKKPENRKPVQEPSKRKKFLGLF
jgi:membrane-bound lytic murein transglycosylase D